ncbi:VPLPA-CTERM sorting domain-containing protein [Pseudooceanicola onchidii]|uniref:VPLPA-CTERM sorting domain-containing protein n=1 Tax=Pseudooceanicola onchidii TaxID=2562279 RepID=UPI00145B5B71|nr:VPLPA-CTERM sorting domain-containing protein [Pseudooceanicola onchidii]
MFSRSIMSRIFSLLLALCALSHPAGATPAYSVATDPLMTASGTLTADELGLLGMDDLTTSPLITFDALPGLTAGSLNGSDGTTTIYSNNLLGIDISGDSLWALFVTDGLSYFAFNFMGPLAGIDAALNDTADAINPAGTLKIYEATLNAVPLPAPALLLVAGLGALAALRRRKRS